MTRPALAALAVAALGLTLVACGRSDFESSVTEAQVEAAFTDHDLAICSSEATDADLPGATAERRLEVAIDCGDAEGTGATVIVTTFDDRDDRDGAAQRFEVQSRPVAAGAVWTLGPLLVRVGGDRDPEAVDRITEALDGLEAQ